ncbi:MAG: hypothetical protein WD072_10150 [Pirellulales bacterium]
MLGEIGWMSRFGLPGGARLFCPRSTFIRCEMVFSSPMQTPLEFLAVFRHELRAAGIPFAITSGMACIRYGLQQTTTMNCR